MIRLWKRNYGSVKEKLMQGLKDAMRARDTDKASIIRLLQAELTLLDKKSSDPVDETAYLSCLQGCYDKWSDAIRQYEAIAKSGTQKEAAERILAKEQGELAIIESYLPAPYSEEELASLLSTIIDAKGKGPIMSKMWPMLDPTRISKKRLSQYIDSKLQ